MRKRGGKRGGVFTREDLIALHRARMTLQALGSLEPVDERVLPMTIDDAKATIRALARKSYVKREHVSEEQ